LNPSFLGEQAMPTMGRRSSFFNTSGALEIRKQSLGAAFSKQ